MVTTPRHPRSSLLIRVAARNGVDYTLRRFLGAVIGHANHGIGSMTRKDVDA